LPCQSALRESKSQRQEKTLERGYRTAGQKSEPIGSRAGARSGINESLFVAVKFGVQISADVTEKKTAIYHKIQDRWRGDSPQRSRADLSPDEKQA
jgi:hypothetical protein